MIFCFIHMLKTPPPPTFPLLNAGIMWPDSEGASAYGSRRNWTKSRNAECIDQCFWCCWEAYGGIIYLSPYERKCRLLILQYVLLLAIINVFIISIFWNCSVSNCDIFYSFLKGISPDVVTYSTLMKAFIRARKFDKVLNFF